MGNANMKFWGLRPNYWGLGAMPPAAGGNKVSATYNERFFVFLVRCYFVSLRNKTY